MQNPDIISPDEMIETARAQLPHVILANKKESASFAKIMEIMTGTHYEESDGASNEDVLLHLIEYLKTSANFYTNDYIDRAVEWAKSIDMTSAITLCAMIIRGAKTENRDSSYTYDKFIEIGMRADFSKPELDDMLG